MPVSTRRDRERQRVTDCNLRAWVGVVQAEARIGIGDAGVPADCAVADQRGDHGAGDRFGHRGELEYGIRIDGGVLAGFADPKSL